MTTGVGQRRPGTWRRWLAAVAGVMAAQVAMVAVLERSSLSPPARAAFATRVHLLPPGEIDGSSGAVSARIDPALFALPSLRGFSGAAWLRYPLLDFQPSNASAPPEWLDLDPRSLGAELRSFLLTNIIAPPLLVDEPLPPVLRYEAGASIAPVSPVSRLQVRGALADRTISGPIDLPAWPHYEVISNTVVQVAVDEAGQPFTVTLRVRCGLSAADEYALRFAENLRFEPMPRTGGPGGRNELTWGDLVFVWRTRAAVATNPPAAFP